MDFEQNKVDLLFAEGQLTPASPAAAVAPVPPGPAQPAPAKSGTDIAGADAPNPDLDRQQAVRAALQKLRQLIVELADTIYQMKLTEDQVSEFAEKMVNQLSDGMNEITVERIKDIANDLLLGVDDSRRTDRKRRKF